MISPIPEIIEDIRQGRMVIIVDDEDRENEGDLIVAAEFAVPAVINFMITHARGLVCLPLSVGLCQRLSLPLMVQNNKSPHHTNFTVSIEAATGVTTGISAYDRARTIEAAIADDATLDDLVQPGHIFPLMAVPGGVLARAGHTEAGCDLAMLAGLKPASVLCEILNDDGTMARLSDLIPFAKKHGLKIGTVSDLIEYRSRTETLIERVVERAVETTSHGPAKLTAFRDKTRQTTHVAIVFGTLSPDVETRVRVHTPVSFLDGFADIGLNRSYTIDSAIRKMAGGPGVLLFLRQPENEDAFVERLTEPETTEAGWDSRIYGVGAQILKALGVGKMRLLGGPFKMPSLSGFGLEVVGFEPASPSTES